MIYTGRTPKGLGETANRNRFNAVAKSGRSVKQLHQIKQKYTSKELYLGKTSWNFKSNLPPGIKVRVKIDGEVLFWECRGKNEIDIRLSKIYPSMTELSNYM